MFSYYDIHTHQKAVDAPDRVSITNYYSGFAEVPLNAPCSVGLHPWHLVNLEADFSLIQLLAVSPLVLAIGECGLDRSCTTPWPLQQSAFVQQIALAVHVRKPLIIHCVRAFDEAIALLRKCRVDVPVIFHGFNKKQTVAEMLIAEGYFLSFGAAILYEDSGAARTLKEIPAGRFFLETDDAPWPIDSIYAKAAAIRDTSPDSLASLLHDNFIKVFSPQ